MSVDERQQPAAVQGLCWVTNGRARGRGCRPYAGPEV